jgi:hypothetical protein
MMRKCLIILSVLTLSLLLALVLFWLNPLRPHPA